MVIFLDFGGIFGNFKVSEVFRSFLRFRGYVGHFLGLGSILVVFWVFVIFGFWGYFGHFRGFGGIFLILWVLAVF